jgi:hypothetical protein
MAGHLLNPGKQDKHKAVAQLEVWPGDRHAFLEQWFGNAEASIPKYAPVWFCLTVPHGQSDGQSPHTRHGTKPTDPIYDPCLSREITAASDLLLDNQESISTISEA